MSRCTTFILLCTFNLMWACGNKQESKDSPTKVNEAKLSNTEEKSAPKSEEQSKQEAQHAEEAQQALKTLKVYFDGLNAGDYESAVTAFAPKVRQWITVKNTTPKAIAKEAERFLRTKKKVNYTLNEESLDMFGNTATVEVRQQWQGYDTTIEIELQFTKDFKIQSYSERKVLKRLKKTSESALEAYLKELPKKSLPFEYTALEDSEPLSDLGMRVLLSPDDISTIKISNGGWRVFQGFWYEISPKVVGIVYLSGGTIFEVMLVTLERSSGKVIDQKSIGAVGRMGNMVKASSNMEFKKNLNILTTTTTTNMMYDDEGEAKEVEETNYYYNTVYPSGKISK